MNGKIAIVGDGDSVLIFKAVGIETYSADSTIKCKEILQKIKNDYQIILLADVYAKELEEYIKEINNEPYPIILTIPSKGGNNGYGMQVLKNEMERSLGVDILFDND